MWDKLQGGGRGGQRTSKGRGRRDDEEGTIEEMRQHNIVMMSFIYVGLKLDKKESERKTCKTKASKCFVQNA